MSAAYWVCPTLSGPQAGESPETTGQRLLLPPLLPLLLESLPDPVGGTMMTVLPVSVVADSAVPLVPLVLPGGVVSGGGVSELLELLELPEPLVPLVLLVPSEPVLLPDDVVPVPEVPLESVPLVPVVPLVPLVPVESVVVVLPEDIVEPAAPVPLVPDEPLVLVSDEPLVLLVPDDPVVLVSEDPLVVAPGVVTVEVSLEPLVLEDPLVLVSDEPLVPEVLLGVELVEVSPLELDDPLVLLLGEELLELDVSVLPDDPLVPEVLLEVSVLLLGEVLLELEVSVLPDDPLMPEVLLLGEELLEVSVLLLGDVLLELEVSLLPDEPLVPEVLLLGEELDVLSVLELPLVPDELVEPVSDVPLLLELLPGVLDELDESDGLLLVVPELPYDPLAPELPLELLLSLELGRVVVLSELPVVFDVVVLPLDSVELCADAVVYAVASNALSNAGRIKRLDFRFMIISIGRIVIKRPSGHRDALYFIDRRYTRRSITTPIPPVVNPAGYAAPRPARPIR